MLEKKQLKLYNTFRCRNDRGVAQFGSALGSGPRGREFESRHLDQLYKTQKGFAINAKPFCIKKIFK